jgi:hypothetical protein
LLENAAPKQSASVRQTQTYAVLAGERAQTLLFRIVPKLDQLYYGAHIRITSESSHEIAEGLWVTLTVVTGRPQQLVTEFWVRVETHHHYTVRMTVRGPGMSSASTETRRKTGGRVRTRRAQGERL